MYFDHGVCVPGVDGKFLKVSLTQCHPSNAWSVFLGFGGEGVVDVDVDTCGWRWMVLPGGFKYFLFLEISNPPWFFFGFHDPPIWGAYFFSKWLGWLGSNYQLDVDLFARFLTVGNSAGLNVTFFGDQVESVNVTFSTDRDLNHLVDVLLGEQWMKHTSVSVNLESWHPNFVDFLRCVNAFFKGFVSNMWLRRSFQVKPRHGKTFLEMGVPTKSALLLRRKHGK